MIEIRDLESAKEYLEKTIAHRSLMRNKLRTFPANVCDDIYLKALKEISEPQ